MVWLPVFWIFRVCADLYACMKLHMGLYKHHKRVCTENWLRKKNPLTHWGMKTCDSIMPGFSVWHSTNWYIPMDTFGVAAESISNSHAFLSCFENNDNGISDVLNPKQIIIIKRISRAPIYHTRWQHRALYNNTNHTHTHAHIRTHTHTRTHSKCNTLYTFRDFSEKEKTVFKTFIIHISFFFCSSYMIFCLTNGSAWCCEQRSFIAMLSSFPNLTSLGVWAEKSADESTMGMFAGQASALLWEH